MSSARSAPCPQYSFVNYDEVSSIYNTVADVLRSMPHWIELSPNHRDLHSDPDLILAPCHGRGLMWNEVGKRQPQLVNYLQGSRGMTLKVQYLSVFGCHERQEKVQVAGFSQVELTFLLREDAARTNEAPFMPLT